MRVDFTDYVAGQRPAVMRFATILTSQTWLADDLVRDVLARAFERWDRISRMAEPNAYVRRMIVNEYLSWRRRPARTAPRADVEPDLPVGDAAAQHANATP
jgi:DNA-directed RNA polymerase specialized sigma24 family protein